MANEAAAPLADDLLKRVEALRNRVRASGNLLLERWRPLIERREYLPSAQNLAYYLAMRQEDLRPLQLELIPWALSSLGRSEAHVIETLDNLVAVLRTLSGDQPRALAHAPETFFVGDQWLASEAERVLGPVSGTRRVRVMATFPTEAATDYELVRSWVDAGLNIARINCAHDSSAEWAAMVAHVRRAEADLGRRCLIEFDLAGPKVRIDQTSFTKHRFVRGDRLLLVRGTPKKGRRFPRQVSCTAPEVLDRLRPGDRIWIDDGVIGGRVEALGPKGVEVCIEQASPRGERIQIDKGLNFPDTPFERPALTAKDLADLDFVVEHADLIAYSFVQTPADVDRLLSEIEQRVEDPERRSHIGIVEKIETATAVRNLPSLIVAAAGRQPLAVMIARGDLAVEVGFERLAELQEEILWICEAGHVPVIWATQVLDQLARTGVPTRSEVTDAAAAERAECVMLNKGPHLADAIGMLDDVLRRMEAHQFKKRTELRALASWPVA
ncbi:MAG: pyruvate kinase [Dehalococcoidia bacterium]